MRLVFHKFFFLSAVWASHQSHHSKAPSGGRASPLRTWQGHHRVSRSRFRFQSSYGYAQPQICRPNSDCHLPQREQLCSREFGLSCFWQGIELQRLTLQSLASGLQEMQWLQVMAEIKALAGFWKLQVCMSCREVNMAACSRIRASSSVRPAGRRESSCCLSARLHISGMQKDPSLASFMQEKILQGSLSQVHKCRINAMASWFVPYWP